MSNLQIIRFSSSKLNFSLRIICLMSTSLASGLVFLQKWYSDFLASPKPILVPQGPVLFPFLFSTYAPSLSSIILSHSSSYFFPPGHYCLSISACLSEISAWMGNLFNSVSPGQIFHTAQHQPGISATKSARIWDHH